MTKTKAVPQEKVTAIVERVIKSYNGIKPIQERFGFTAGAAISNWKTRGLPEACVAQIHIDTNIPVRTLMLAVKNPRVRRK